MNAPLHAHIWIDCYGKSYRQEFHVNAQRADFSFIFDPDKKKGKPFALGLYLDHAALSRDLKKYPINRRIAVLMESPLLLDQIESRIDLDQRFGQIFVHRKSRFERGNPYSPLFFGTTWLEDVWERTYSKKKLLSFIGSLDHPDDPGYKLRREIAEFCAADPKTDCFGKGIQPIESKMTGLEDYAFSVAMENTQEDYYFTEKLIDCFLTETVPIYWGGGGIGDLFDKRGILLFNDLMELKNISARLTFSQYEAMLPYVRINKQIAIQNHWHTLTGVYIRLASALIANHGLNQRVTLEPLSTREHLAYLLTRPFSQ